MGIVLFIPPCSTEGGSKGVQSHARDPLGKLPLGSVPCVGVNPKLSVRSKQEQWQHLRSALLMKVILGTVLAALRNEQHCGVQEGISWCARHPLEVWGTET